MNPLGKIIDNWREASTLGEWILKQLRAGKQNSEEFQAMLRVIGRQRFEEAYKKAVREEKEKVKK